MPLTRRLNDRLKGLNEMHVMFAGDDRVSLGSIVEAAGDGVEVSVDSTIRDRVEVARSTLVRFVDEERVIYGVNTSMGGFVDWLVPTTLATTLQENLINAVATNVGSYVDDHTTRSIMLSRIVSLSRGHSAISIENFDKLVAIYNAGVVPCIPEKGSLGTSGDLGPLAAIALVCIGQGKARLHGKAMAGADVLAQVGIEPMHLSYKEGLALINGTSGMVGMGAIAVERARYLLDTYLTVSALSIEGLAGMTKPFDPRVHRLKPHIGQQEIAERIWSLLGDSTLAVVEEQTARTLAGEMGDAAKAGSQPIEDAYSIRCTPQILGPVLETLRSVTSTVENELNSSNDNPLIIPNEDDVFHNGHFHGQYVAMAMDHLTIAMTTLTNLANRRVDRFLDKGNSNGLPSFLCNVDPGLRLGLMGGQFMTASLTAENRSLAMPVSIQSLTSTGDFQDIVSFGFVAARRATEVLRNAMYVVAFELICACQAIDIRGAEGLSSSTRPLYEQVRKIVPFLDQDISITDYVESVVEEVLSPDWARSGQVDR
ncbi:phenylalanine aminomutase (D-beta-phenylalanine forming) [Saccharopolyspora shandongensis]|uniref:phenylalanine aminomutase (D-beta-phenylalanine forming) n=1 Tax=Saccharopolyspora shandongensis TaxID=418495 RepID=UPI0034085385